MSSEDATKTRKTFVEYGKKYVGCPYVSGATGPAAFDCSGFVYAVSRESIGWQLPRQVKNIYSYTKIIDDSKREAGDLVFFKTTSSGDVSHIGIYIGNGQFLHCASDGPNTGVILSSLNESYWKNKYYCTGRFLPASGESSLAKNPAPESFAQASAKSDDKPRTSSQSSSAKSGSVALKNASSEKAKPHPVSAASARSSSGRFADRIILDGIFAVDWSLFTPEYFRLNFRGLQASLHATYEGRFIRPGIGAIFKWDKGTETFQLPLVASIELTESVRIFAGPVITGGTPRVPGDSDRKIKASFFPGIIGLGWQSPSIQAGKARLSLSQEVQYTVFNERDGSSLSFIKSVGTGFVLSSGIRVTLPLRELKS